MMECLRSLHLVGSNPPETVIDLETTGTQAFNPSVRVVAVGFCNEYGSLSIDVRETPELYNAIVFLLYGGQVPLIAHNVAFDAAFLTRDLNLSLNGGKYPQWYHEWKFHNWACCTYAAYRTFASEGFIGQQWGLRSVEEQVILWKDTNKKALARSMVELGILKKQIPKALKEKLCPPTTSKECDSED
jgi:DNA polymerase III epsilon subunit-like protein